ncbi:MAG: ABC transporter ATP-binding protein [Acidimicrobiaceae bacterium]|nr:ABC transporter ATP-binding protein [Acidimicrobiaceae bacterium]
MDDDAILRVRGLRVRPPAVHVDLIRGIDLDLSPGRCFGLAGESGAGATTLIRAFIGLLPRGAEVRGSIRLQGQELVGLGERAWRHVRGQQVGMVLRDPGVALDRTVRIGAQVAETLKVHKRVRRSEVSERVAMLLEEVGLPAATAGQFPRDLGAAEGRRAMLAAALAGDPSLLLVDGGPPWLDVEEHVAFGSLVAAITRSRGLASMVISHQIGTLAPFTDEIGVLCGGLLMEQTNPVALAASPRVPYTSALLYARPDEAPEPERPEPRVRLGDRPGYGLGLRLPAAARREPPKRPTVDENLLVGCSYSLRCARAVMACREHEPRPVEEPAGHRWACWNPLPPPD